MLGACPCMRPSLNPPDIDCVLTLVAVPSRCGLSTCILLLPSRPLTSPIDPEKLGTFEHKHKTRAEVDTPHWTCCEVVSVLHGLAQ